MAVSGLPTNAGVGILSNNLREEVKKFCLLGTSDSSSDVVFDETSTLDSLSGYMVGKFDISRAYFDDAGTLTFECPIPYDFDSLKWIGACGLIHIDPSNGAETLVAVSSMPRFQKTSGIGGTVHYKVPIAGESSSVIFEDMPYVTRQELDVVLNEQFSQSAIALDEASLANREIAKTLTQRIQSGVSTIFNRGIKKGCSLSKSTDATRNLSLANGVLFMHGRIYSIFDMPNTASVPQNTSNETKYCYAYLWIDTNGNIQVDCTDLGGSVPDDGLTLYKVTVPANSTEATNPYLEDCILTDLRHIESNYPKVLVNAPFVYVPLEFDLLDTDYSIEIDIIEFEGGGFQLGYCYGSNRAKNGFNINLNGTADSVKVRWTVKKLNL
jgi:hypothetical protein